MLFNEVERVWSHLIVLFGPGICLRNHNVCMSIFIGYKINWGHPLLKPGQNYNKLTLLHWLLHKKKQKFQESHHFHFVTTKYNCCIKNWPSPKEINPSSPNSDLSQISHYSVKSLSVREVIRIENMIIQLKLSLYFNSFWTHYFCKKCIVIRKENL